MTTAKELIESLIDEAVGDLGRAKIRGPIKVNEFDPSTLYHKYGFDADEGEGLLSTWNVVFQNSYGDFDRDGLTFDFLGKPDGREGTLNIGIGASGAYAVIKPASSAKAHAMVLKVVNALVGAHFPPLEGNRDEAEDFAYQVVTSVSGVQGI